MRKTCISLILFLLVTVIIKTSNAGENISIRLNLGAINYPLHDWSEFMGSVENSDFKKDDINLFGAIALYHNFNSNHAIFMGTEYLTTNASLYSKIGDYAELYANWVFKATPIDIGYEHVSKKSINWTGEGFHPLFTVGVSYMISEVVGESYTVPEIVPPQNASRTGNGYGIFGGIGVHKFITQNLYCVANFRVRYSDGMYFTDDKEDIDVEFTSADLNLGVGWCF